MLRERDLLLSLNHPNIIRMHSCFKVSITISMNIRYFENRPPNSQFFSQDDKNLYFVFENATNGDLDKLIKKCKNKLPEDMVRLLFA